MCLIDYLRDQVADSVAAEGERRSGRHIKRTRACRRGRQDTVCPCFTQPWLRMLIQFQLQDWRLLHLPSPTRSPRNVIELDESNRGGSRSGGREAHYSQGGNVGTEGSIICEIWQKHQLGDINFDFTMIPFTNTLV